MQSRTEDATIKLETPDTQEKRPKSYELYEEYAQTDIESLARARKEMFSATDGKSKKEMEAQVQTEIDDFRTWLEEEKDFDSGAAHYCSISLKSLFLGLPVGEEVARLFDAILDP